MKMETLIKREIKYLNNLAEYMGDECIPKTKGIQSDLKAHARYLESFVDAESKAKQGGGG